MGFISFVASIEIVQIIALAFLGAECKRIGDKVDRLLKREDELTKSEVEKLSNDPALS